MPIIRALDLGPVSLPGTGYPPLAAFDLPVRTGMTGAFFLGDGPNIAVSNWAGGASASILDAPAFHAGYASFGPQGRLQTAIPETLSMSMLVIGRRTDAGQNTGFMGNYPGSGAARGVAIYAQTGSASIIGMAGRVGDPPNMANDGKGNVDQWTLGVLSVPATGASMFYNVTASIAAPSAATADREINGAGAMQIGATYARSGACDIALAIFWNRALTAVEKDSVASWARAYASTRGITV